MEDLTVELVIAFHDQVIQTEGGDNRLLSEANLHQMVFLVNRIEEVFQRAALAFFTLVAYPAFREGNGHTAQHVAEKILTDNGYIPADSNDSMTGLVQGIGSFLIEQADIEEWLRLHYKKIG
ncbi:MAG: hypothetical protein Q7J03_07100 [Methanoregula sp.]|nr:hypothetical protein [Methanoregula sp.]